MDNQTCFEFEAALAEAGVSRTDLNRVIFDYLIAEGFTEAAGKFASEARLHMSLPKQQLSNDRVRIRNAICSGRPAEALTIINSEFPDLLDENSYIHFSLLRAELIELIRKCFESPDVDINIPIQFATDNLAPIAIKDSRRLNEMEQAMALLLFGKKGPPPGALVGVSMDLIERVKLADAIDEVLLAAKSTHHRPQLADLFRTRIWAERTAQELNLNIPNDLPISMDELVEKQGD